MRTSNTCFSALLVAALVLAAPVVMAQTPPAPAPAPAAAPAAPAQAAPAAPAKPATPTAAVAAEDPGNFTIPPGWRLRKVKGEMVYCKQEVVLGSRFPKLICMDLERLKAYEANNAENRDRMGQANRICIGTDCGGN